MSTRAAALSRAFSLVEVLVAVLVLALGLLGLGAVFPVVVRQQRIATQATLGVSAGEAAKQVLLSNDNFKPGGRGWPALREYVFDEGGKNAPWVHVAMDPSTGNYVIPPAAGDPLGDVILPLSQRLSPLPFSSDSQPRFVWDIAARITNPLAKPEDRVLLVSVFLRPIDPGIRPGRYRDDDGDSVPFSLVNSLVGNLSKANRRYPVSVDGDGRPTFDGRHEGPDGAYAIPLVARVMLADVNPGRMDEIAIDQMVGGSTNRGIAANLLAIPGQRFVDRDGQVYAVMGGGAQAIRIMPPLEDTDGDGDVQDDTNPIVFVPQPPAVDPIVFAVTP